MRTYIYTFIMPLFFSRIIRIGSLFVSKMNCRFSKFKGKNLIKFLIFFFVVYLPRLLACLLFEIYYLLIISDGGVLIGLTEKIFREIT